MTVYRAMFVKNPVPDEIDEVIDFPIPRKISPELSRQIEEEMLPKGTDVDPIADMIQGLKQGKTIPYGPDFDLDKTYDVCTSNVFDFMTKRCFFM